MSCSLCADRDDFFLHHQQRAVELAVDIEQHAMLLRRNTCGALWNVHPDEKGPREELAADEARRRYPGAL